jgi:hypothetical protein
MPFAAINHQLPAINHPPIGEHRLTPANIGYIRPVPAKSEINEKACAHSWPWKNTKPVA